jgi:hypothetical protein
MNVINAELRKICERQLEMKELLEIQYNVSFKISSLFSDPKKMCLFSISRKT